MIITLERNEFTRESTIGVLRVGERQCFTLEDTIRDHKIAKQTAIPYGHYRLTLRRDGGMHERYTRNFGSLHRGMLWLRDIPQYEYVYIHIGNAPQDTEGCILVGNTRGKDWIGQSRDAYWTIYPLIADAIESGEDVQIEIMK